MKTEISVNELLALSIDGEISGMVGVYGYISKAYGYITKDGNHVKAFAKSAQPQNTLISILTPFDVGIQGFERLHEEYLDAAIRDARSLSGTNRDYSITAHSYDIATRLYNLRDTRRLKDIANEIKSQIKTHARNSSWSFKAIPLNQYPLITKMISDNVCDVFFNYDKDIDDLTILLTRAIALLIAQSLTWQVMGNG